MEVPDECRQALNVIVIGQVDGITELLPDVDQQQTSREYVKKFQKQLKGMTIPKRFTAGDLKELQAQLKRLHQNIVEIGELSIMGSGVRNKVVRKCDELVGKKEEITQ